MRASVETLFLRFRERGDTHALARVYDAVAPELHAVALRLGGDAVLAEDLVQGVFLVAIERADTWESDRPLRPWLVGVLANLVREHKRRDRAHPIPDALTEQAPDAPVADASAQELEAQVGRALERIPEPFREVLRMRVLRGLSASEIAKALRRSPGTVRSQLQRGLERLRLGLPAGLLGAFVPIGPRGLGEVRRVVLADAATRTGAHTVSWIAGIMMMKKLVAAVAIVAAVGALWSLQSQPRELETAARPESPIQPALDSPSELAHAPSIERASEDHVRQVATSDTADPDIVMTPPEPEPPVAASGETATLLVRARWEDSDDPVPGEIVVLRYTNPIDLPEIALPTDDDGRLEVTELPGGWAYAQLLRGRASQVRLVPGATTEIDLAVPRGLAVSGRVMDGDGAPIAGAGIWVSERWLTNKGHIVARSDEDGAFELEGMTDDHFVGARLDDYVPSSLEAPRGRSGDRATVRLVLHRLGYALEGRVLDTMGEPVANAEVLVGTEHPENISIVGGGSGVAPPPQRARTDASGAFTMRGVPAGDQPYAVRAAGFGVVAGMVPIAESDHNRVDVTMRTGARLEGTVENSAGEPVAQARVAFGDVGHFSYRATHTDALGNYRLTDLPEGDVRLWAGHDDHGVAIAELRLRADETTRWDVTLAARPRIIGRLVDADGEPVEGYNLAVRTHLDAEGAVWRSSRSGREGRFEIVDVARQAHTVHVRDLREGPRFSELRVDEVWPSETPLELTLPDVSDRGGFVGTVETATGAPPREAHIGIWHREWREWRSFPVDQEDGTFRVTHVPDGTCDITIESPDHPKLELDPVSAHSGELTDLGLLTLGSGGLVAGRLVGVDDTVIETVSLELVDEHGRGVASVERLGRSFRSEVAAAGTYDLVVQAVGALPHRERIEVPTSGEVRPEVALTPAGVRVVQISVPPNTPAPEVVWVGVLDSYGRPIWRKTQNANTGFRFPISVAAGEATVRVSTNDDRVAQRTVRFPSAEATLDPVTIVLE